jgi:outer membrane protein assembly factor BamB
MKSSIRIIAGALCVVTLAASDWPQFRGPDSAGISRDTGLPEKWRDDNNIGWKVSLPGRGVSSPAIVGDRIYLTASSGMNQTRLHVLCFAAESGARLWERQLWATGPTNCHPKTCPAAPTPVADCDRVFALFATGDLVCFDRDGNMLWFRSLQSDYPAMTNYVGRAASLILWEKTLIVPMESQGASYLIGIDAESGGNHWRTDRPLDNSYATPVLARHGDRIDLVAQAMGEIAGFDPATGIKRWEFIDRSISCVASPVAASDGLVLAIGREAIALRLAANGPPEVEWRSTRLGTGTPTPIVNDGRVYALKDGGTLVCGDLRSGKELWTERLRGTYSASPVLADGKLLAINEEGETTVVRLNDKPQRIAANPLAGPMLASPAIARGGIFLRTDRMLYRIGRGNGAS